MLKFAFCLAAGAMVMMVASLSAAEKDAPAALSFKMKSLDGKDVDLSKYQGKVVLIVNVASRCGNTKQYKPLEAMHEKLGEKGLAVLGFPCNQFGGQEPGTEEEIAEFCSTTYGVKFPMFSKIDVNGEKQAPLYKYLTSVETKPVGPGKISWNFEKFVLNKKGVVVARFAPGLSPDSAEVMKVIEAELAK
jgi:glutathione peroxidase